MKIDKKQTIVTTMTPTQRVPIQSIKPVTTDRFADDLYGQAMEFVGGRFSVFPKIGSTVRFRDELHPDGAFSIDTVIDAVLYVFGALSVGEAQNLVANAIKQRKIRALSGKKVFCPNQDTIYQDDTGLWIENLWRAPRVPPKAGTLKPFFDFCCYLFPNPAERAYVLGMLKYKVQHPVSEPKQAHSLYLFSTGQGIGKGLFKNTLSAVIGEDNVTQLISQNELKSQNAPQYMRKAIMFVEEANVVKSSRTYDLLKAYITESQTGTNYKFQDSGQEKIPAMIIFLSNRPPEFLEEGDRRFFIPELAKVIDREKTNQITSDYANWINQPINIAAVSYWFYNSALKTSEMENWEISALKLDRDNLVNYDPQGPALRTDAYRQAIDNNMPDYAILLAQDLGIQHDTDDSLVLTLELIDQKFRLSYPTISNREKVMGQLGYYKKRLRMKGYPNWLYIKEGWNIRKESNKAYVVHESGILQHDLKECLQKLKRYSGVSF